MCKLPDAFITEKHLLKGTIYSLLKLKLKHEVPLQIKSNLLATNKHQLSSL